MKMRVLFPNPEFRGMKRPMLKTIFLIKMIALLHPLEIRGDEKSYVKNDIFDKNDSIISSAGIPAYENIDVKSDIF